MAKFISGKKLDDAICDTIHNAKKRLLLVSPYIKLDGYFRKLFDKHRSNADLHIIIAFGKNKNDPSRSFSREDFDFFKEFPFISVIYVPDLHAKYYANESRGVITSINLYDYSFKNNIEFGVLCETTLIGGDSLDKEAWDATMEILATNNAVFIRRPMHKKGWFGLTKNYRGSKDEFDQTNKLLSGKPLEEMKVFDFTEGTLVDDKTEPTRMTREQFEQVEMEQETPIRVNVNNAKLVSATVLGKPKNKSYKEVKAVLQTKGFIGEDTITTKGLSAGLQLKKSREGNEYIVYPEGLREEL